MPSPENLPVLATTMNLSARQVANLANSGVIPRADGGKYDLLKCLHGYIKHLQDKVANPPSNIALLDDLRWTATRYSDVLGKDRRMVAKLLEIAPPDGEKKGRPVWHVRNGMEAIFKPSQDRDEVAPEDLPPREREQWFNSELTRLKVEAQAGRLIPDTEVEVQMANLIAPMIQMLETLPDILERDCDLTPAQVERVMAACDAERARIAEALES